MVGTIAPLVQGLEQQNHRVRARGVLAAYVAVTTTGALGLGIVVLGLRTAVETWVPAVADRLVAWGPALLAGSAAYLLLAALTRAVPLPMIDRQVPLRWRVEWGPAKASMAYGFVLGAAVLTRIHSPGFYLVPLAVLVAPHPALGLVAVAAFGLAKGGAVAVKVAADRRPAGPDPDEDARLTVAHRHGLVAAQAIGLAALAVAGAGLSVAAAF